MLGFDAVGKLALGQLPSASTPVAIGWYAPLTTPVRAVPRLRASQQQFFAFYPTPLVSFSWFSGLSEPPRFRAGLKPPQQQFHAFYPTPLVSFSWFEALAEPVRKLPRSPAAMAPFHFMQPMPSPFVATGWFMALAEPVRSRPALPPPHNPVFTIDTTPVPTTKIMPWFALLSEPVRFREGLAAARQQFLATPSRLLPTPTVIGRLDAIETKDVFTGGARAWNRVTEGEVGVIEQSFTGAEVGAIVTRPSVGTSGLIEPIAIPASGSVVPVITTASVSIRIV